MYSIDIPLSKPAIIDDSASMDDFRHFLQKAIASVAPTLTEEAQIILHNEKCTLIFPSSETAHTARDAIRHAAPQFAHKGIFIGKEVCAVYESPAPATQPADEADRVPHGSPEQPVENIEAALSLFRLLKATNPHGSPPRRPSAAHDCHYPPCCTEQCRRDFPGGDESSKGHTLAGMYDL